MNDYNKTLTFDVLTAADGSAITIKTAAYTAGDCVGGQLSCHFGTDSGGTIRGLHLRDAGAKSEPLTIRFYHTLASTIADDAAFAPTAADSLKEIGQVSIAAGNYDVQTNYSIVHKKGADVDIEIPGNLVSNGIIYLYLECVNAADWVAAGDLTITLDLWVD
jgi:hypothetical protein